MRPFISKTQEEKPKKRGFVATLKESMIKTSEGCGSDCGCHIEANKTEETSKKKDASKCPLAPFASMHWMHLF